MLGTIAGGLASLGLSQSVAKKVAPWAVGGAIGLVALLGALLALHFYVEGKVEEALLEREVAEAEAALKAERRANAGELDRAAGREAASDETLSKLEVIENEDPEAAAAPAPRGSRAVADRLRGSDDSR